MELAGFIEQIYSFNRVTENTPPICPVCSKPYNDVNKLCNIIKFKSGCPIYYIKEYKETLNFLVK